MQKRQREARQSRQTEDTAIVKLSFKCAQRKEEQRAGRIEKKKEEQGEIVKCRKREVCEDNRRG